MWLAVGLPDLHPGKGSPIGAAFAVEGCVYPALVGNDVGCGMGFWRVDLNAKRIKRNTWADQLRNLDNSWEGDVQEFLRERGIGLSGFEVSLGTIGGGNHFAEFQAIEQITDPQLCGKLGIVEGSVYLCVHSGSRGLGQSILNEQLEKFGTGGLEVGTEQAGRYLARHDHARRWASANRELIAIRMFERLRTQGSRLIDVCHNYVEQVSTDGRTCWIHRKGAVPSTEGAVVIPGSRGALSYIVQPREPGPRSAFSLAHGAGRKWPRSDCRARLERRFSAKDLAHTKMGSTVICEDKELLFEEAPQAYKNIATVVNDLVSEGLADVIATLRPLLTYKVRR
jgi:release factor H-coupled RctB family protein